jgi:hypothetical protein
MSVKFSIVNYGFNVRSEVPKDSKQEDEDLLKSARLIIDKHNFGKGAAIVSEAFHTDLTNFNNYHYVSDGMNNHIKSFYSPFFTPFLTYHDTMTKPLGTNLEARYIKKPIETSRGVASGYGKVVTFIPEASTFNDEKTIDLIQQRRFMALSIGSQTSKQNMRCNICNKSIFDDECSHVPGRDYEGQKCFIKISKPRFSEYSAVMGDPADIDAIIRRMDCYDSADHKTTVTDHKVDLTSDPWAVTIYDGISTKIFDTAGLIIKPETDDQISNDNTKDKDMPGKSELAEVISSYEARIESLEKENTVLTSALVKANNTINDLKKVKQSEDTPEVPEQTSSEVQPPEEEPAKDSVEVTDEISSETEVPVEDVKTEDKDTQTETETSVVTTESEVTENITDSVEEPVTTETTTESEVIPGSSSEDIYTMLRSHRERLLSTKGNGVSLESRSYRISSMINIDN